MRFIHCADLHFGLQKYGSVDIKTGLNSRIKEDLEQFDKVVNYAISKKRNFTPRECARLHGFPETFVLPEEVSITEQYNQFANTMTVPVVGAIFKELVVN